MTRPKARKRKATFECCSKVNISEDSMCNCSECKARGALTEEGKMKILKGMTNEGEWRAYTGKGRVLQVFKYSDDAMRFAENGAGIPVEIGQFQALLDWVEKARAMLLKQTFNPDKQWIGLMDELDQIQQPRSAEDE